MIKVLLKKIKNYYKTTNKFLQIFVNIIYFILIVYMCICALNLLYLWLGREYFSWFVSIVLISLVITDEKIKVKGKFIFIFILVILLLMYFYWDLLYIDLIKDIFWFTLVLNVGYVWHNLILDRILRSVKRENQYIRFMITRISWITSVTLWVALLKDIQFILREINNFIKYLDVNKSYEKYKINYNIIWIIAIIESILWYFIEMFKNYSLFLMGRKKLNIKFDWNLLRIIVIFIITLIISIKLNIVRIYLIWMLIIVYKISYLIKQEYNMLNKSNIRCNKGKTKYELIIQALSFSEIMLRWCHDHYRLAYKKFIDDFIKDWEKIYEKDMYGELLIFIEEAKYNRTGNIFYSFAGAIAYEYLNKFDLLYVFWYSGDIDESKIKLVMRVDDLKNMLVDFSCDYLFITDEEEDKFFEGKARIITEWTEERKDEKKKLIEWYGLKLTLDEYMERIDKRVEAGDESYPLILWIPLKENPLSLKEYLGLTEGAFFIIFRFASDRVYEKELKKIPQNGKCKWVT